MLRSIQTNMYSLSDLCRQVEPDPEFPTVKFPNPEEGKSALVSFSLMHLQS